MKEAEREHEDPTAIMEFIATVPVMAKRSLELTKEETELTLVKIQSIYNKHCKKENGESPFNFKMSQEEFNKFFNNNSNEKEDSNENK